ncbi:MAG TPA: two-component sensor histidine kinase [Planctomycetaceae bacterium]|nr:two-component sensor histidine kinase [Phycisphaerae bacterium]HAY81310.1 two-component sensor histidine kinase [Planctomycetaceae bacterium]
MDATWFIIGIGAGMVATVPVLLWALRRATRRAREAEGESRHNQRLAELGAMTSGLAHEIKNPLSTVGLNAQLLQEDLAHLKIDEEERDRLVRRIETLHREVDRLRGILTDFLEFAGRIKLDVHPQDVRGIVEDLGDFYHPQCDQAGVVMRLDIQDEPAIADVDEGMLKQSLLNLMLNAVQAMRSTEGGGSDELILRVSSEEDRVLIQVVDTGPGIPEDMQQEIFHPYVSGRKGGTGLGLPTARRIVEEHGGRIVVDSEAGKGTAFTIQLPAAGP